MPLIFDKEFKRTDSFIDGTTEETIKFSVLLLRSKIKWSLNIETSPLLSRLLPFLLTIFISDISRSVEKSLPLVQLPLILNVESDFKLLSIFIKSGSFSIISNICFIRRSFTVV